MSENPIQTYEPGYVRPDDSLWTRIWYRMLSVETRSMLGILMFLAMAILLGWIAYREPTRMENFTNQYHARAVMRGAGLFKDNCAPCHGQSGEGTEGVAPKLNNSLLFDGSRLKEMGWGGTLEDFVRLTISAGRPARSNPAWPNPMPTWSQDYGGPLRPDQIDDLVAFVLNWGCAYKPECAGPGYVPPPTAAPPVPTPTMAPIVVADIVAALPAGDEKNGQSLFLGTASLFDGKAAGCNACHSTDGSTLVGPSLKGISDRKPEGYDTIEQYIVESVYLPNAHKVPGFENLQMPQNFSQRMSPDYQDLADIMAFLLTLK
jgi:mono/diheme cytochrome c family protein